MTEKTSIKICVTGASGFLASWIIKKLLEKGYTVHGTVRDLANADKVKHLTEIADQAPGSLEFFAADLLEPGSFDAAIAGCEGVIHTASPFAIGKIKDPQNSLIRPAVAGTTNVLESANRTESVRRVVLTSSVVSIYGDSRDILAKDSGIFDESDWNTTSTETHQPYSFSKVSAERAAWELAEKQDRWSLVVMNPSFILGPSLTDRKDSASINFIIELGTGVHKMGVPDLSFGVVDIRNVADAHILGFEKTETEGRHILSADTLSFMQIADTLREAYGDGYPFPKKVLPKWLVQIVGPLQGAVTRKYVARNVGYRVAFDNSKARTELGIEFIDLKKTLVDQFRQLLTDGLIPDKSS